MRTLLALDPGESTGWSMWEYGDDTPLRCLDHGTILFGLKGFIKWWGENRWHMLADEVVCESFILDGRTVKPNVTPLQIEGALAVLWGDTAYQRNTYKAHAPDEFLKAQGLWWKGKGHDRDSARHAFAYVKTRKHMPSLLHYWPPLPIAA